MICFYSGTGNSEYVAEVLAKELGDNLLNINLRIKNKDYSGINVGGRLIFVTPTYAWRMPKIVQDWILHTSFNNTNEVYYVLTCGDEIGNSDKYNQILSSKKHFNHMGTFKVIMPENYIALYNAPNEEESKEIIKRAQSVINNIVISIKTDEKINNAVTFKDKLKSSIINPFFYHRIVGSKKFYTTNECIGCGKCVSICPLNNIELKNNRPKWQNNCTHCMACICYCPTKAIEYGKNSIGKERYYFKESYLYNRNGH